MSNQPDTTKVVTGLVRFSYVNVFKPQAINGSTDEKYSVSLIIPKTDKVTLNKIKTAIAAATEKGKTAKWGGKLPKALDNPLHDGDVEKEDDEVYAGSFYLNAKCKGKPGVVDKHKMPITDEEDFYSGCYGYASVNFFAYDAAGNKGIGCGLNNVMKWRDGENLGGRASAENDFEAIEAEDDDENPLD